VLGIDELPVPVRDPADPLGPPEGTDIALEDAFLRYGPDRPYALEGLTMAVPAGKRVALVGRAEQERAAS